METKRPVEATKIQIRIAELQRNAAQLMLRSLLSPEKADTREKKQELGQQPPTSNV